MFQTKTLLRISVEQQSARLLRSHVGIVDDLRAQRDHQRRDGALAVALVARGEIFIHAIGGAARGTLFQLSRRDKI